MSAKTDNMHAKSKYTELQFMLSLMCVESSPISVKY